jgi:hypothetical protein
MWSFWSLVFLWASGFSNLLAKLEFFVLVETKRELFKIFFESTIKLDIFQMCH